ncbi:phenylacetate-CoA oxygenase subunit PaaJ [Heyndrickxia vini]|uniref:Phenylacetate-CoA oxygenase subunit PaaJ n=1 Tax=Heyndrickxia vini TaxID=1476025 RepID=A0ABX7DY32_9BACI|nr:1,2-phenylacetyl-CoA epoxidase subunit PaaD [Heyndrickxia vini]QQZ08393.1 phenylacetate-CoA oxygenase subunit PaaJ [Heyndrickxia vini]
MEILTLNNELLIRVEKCLENVKDPEIPSVSVVDLGMIEEIKILDFNKIHIKALPTFLGCPALEIIRKNITEAILQISEVTSVEVEFIYHPPWTSDRISEDGKERLKQFGIAPPPVFNDEIQEWKVECPYCGSYYTTMENLFGPTACRSILYCKACKNPFEAMKPISNLM